MKSKNKISGSNREKLECLYEKYKNMMYAESINILKDKSLAEDAVHQSFVKIMDKLDRIDEENVPKTKSFLYIVCRNVAFDMYRRIKTENGTMIYTDLMEIYDSDTADEKNEPFDLFIGKEAKSEIIAKINELPEIYKDVIILEYYHDYTKKEIAQLLNENYDTIRKRSERARSILYKSLRKEEYPYEEGNCKQDV